MQNDPKAEYVRKDLYNELRWLLCAATEWDACKQLAEKNIKEPCFHLQVYTMDSVFLHARSLYEFFTATDKSITQNEKKGLQRLTWRAYSQTACQTSEQYKKFMKPLHGRVMHLDKDRAGYDEIKIEVVNLATDILRLWNAFARNPGLKPYASLLEKFRDQAIGEAASVAEQYKEHGFESPFSLTAD